MKNRLLKAGLILLIILHRPYLQAQTFTLDWGASFVPAWAAGNSNGTAINIGGSGVDATVNIALTGSGMLVAPYPRVNNNNSNGADFVVQAASDALEIDINLGNKTSYYTTTFSFTNTITSLTFGISDIDRPGGGTPWTYSDFVTVTGNGPGGAVTPTLTLYNPASTILGIVGNTASANNGAGGGNVNSLNQGIPSQNGTIFVDFGAAQLSTITIVYGTQNIAQVNANPGLQAISIGNMSFQLAGTLPLTLLDFNAEALGEKAKLTWTTVNEQNTASFEIEHAGENQVFSMVGREAAAGFSTTELSYQFVHHAPTAGTNFYRLKMIDRDGSYEYSKIVLLRMRIQILKILRMVNPFTQLDFQLYAPARTNLTVRILDMKGSTVYHRQLVANEGSMTISVPEASRLASGQYVLQVISESSIISLPIIKL